MIIRVKTTPLKDICVFSQKPGADSPPWGCVLGDGNRPPRTGSSPVWGANACMLAHYQPTLTFTAAGGFGRPEGGFLSTF